MRIWNLTYCIIIIIIYMHILNVILSVLLQYLMMEVVSTSETSVNFYETTQRNIPEVILQNNNM
jgi:hypothetical protein